MNRNKGKRSSVKTMSVHRSTYISPEINSTKAINSNPWVL